MFFIGRPQSWQPLRRLALVAVMASAALATGTAQARPPPMLQGTVSEALLPPEGRATMRLIRLGGPFPNYQDGAVFANRERILPSQPRGFYREYTVRTQGSRDRGARRIVCGGAQPKSPEACFYTSDHYASFSRIRP